MEYGLIVKLAVVLCVFKRVLPLKGIASFLYTKCPSLDIEKGMITLGQHDSWNECFAASIDKPWCAGIVFNRHIHLCVGLPNDILARIDVQQHAVGHSFTHRYTCLLIKKTSLPPEIKQVRHKLLTFTPFILVRKQGC